VTAITLVFYQDFGRMSRLPEHAGQIRPTGDQAGVAGAGQHFGDRTRVLLLDEDHRRRASRHPTPVDLGIAVGAAPSMAPTSRCTGSPGRRPPLTLQGEFSCGPHRHLRPAACARPRNGANLGAVPDVSQVCACKVVRGQRPVSQFRTGVLAQLTRKPNTIARTMLSHHCHAAVRPRRRNCRPTDLVFTTKYGLPIDLRNFNRSWDNRVVRSGVGRSPFTTGAGPAARSWSTSTCTPASSCASCGTRSFR